MNWIQTYLFFSNCIRALSAKYITIGSNKKANGFKAYKIHIEETVFLPTFQRRGTSGLISNSILSRPFQQAFPFFPFPIVQLISTFWCSQSISANIWTWLFSPLLRDFGSRVSTRKRVQNRRSGKLVEKDECVINDPALASRHKWLQLWRPSLPSQLMNQSARTGRQRELKIQSLPAEWMNEWMNEWKVFEN